jgi:hypothetical protein
MSGLNWDLIAHGMVVGFPEQHPDIMHPILPIALIIIVATIKLSIIFLTGHFRALDIRMKYTNIDRKEL